MKVDWDETQNLANQAKHDVSFQEASALFSSGVEYIEVFDETHSDREERLIAIGPIRRGLVLVVWTEREDGVTRIISARWTTKREQAAYWSLMEQQQ